jgi:hypothetical protein
MPFIDRLLNKKQIISPASIFDIDLTNLKKVISFSLYGNVQKYLGGLIENCRHINQTYPDFWIYVYLGNDFDQKILDGKFHEIKNLLFIETQRSGHEVASWRFFAIDRPEVGIAFCRDTDSRINARDQYCINEFLKTDKKFQIIRDNPLHNVAILAGMWGIKKGININFYDLFRRFKSEHFKFEFGNDQDFLADYIYPRVRDHAIMFDEFFKYKNETRVKIPLPYDEHVGAHVYLYHNV